MWQTNGGLEKLFELESLWRFELISTLSEKRRRRYSETYTAVSGDKRVNEIGCGCGHASTMCRPVLACARKNFFTSPLCTTVCVCEKTLRLFEQAIHFELTAYPTHAPYACLCTHTNFKLGQTANVVCDLRRITEVSGCVGIVTSLGRVVSLSFGWLEVLNLELNQER